MARGLADATARAPAAARAPGRPRRGVGLGVYGTYALSFLTLGVVWHVAATYLVPSVLFAPPLSVLAKMGELARSGVLFEHVGVSLRRILIGFALGSVLGIPIGLLMGNLGFVKRFLEPYTEFFRFIPAIAFLTVAVIWFGIGETSKIFLIVYTTIFIVILNTMAGVLSIPRNKVRAAQCLGASRSQIFLYVSIPATLPFILTGMRIAMGNSFATIVSAGAGHDDVDRQALHAGGRDVRRALRPRHPGLRDRSAVPFSDLPVRRQILARGVRPGGSR
jgi:NitT/TauT family transport system permease protein